MEHDQGDEEPLDSLTGQPVVYGEQQFSTLTPEGEIQAAGDFARGFGPRRVKIAIFVTGALIFVALLAGAVS
jgi:hypothetical protein